MQPRAFNKAHQNAPGADKSKRGGTQPLHAAQIDAALLTLKTASAVAGLSEATLYRRAKDDPTFPRLIRIGTRCTRIRAGDLTAWLSSKAEG
jgi:predicted DNA-binding transcriptional regulator AlpA